MIHGVLKTQEREDEHVLRCDVARFGNRTCEMECLKGVARSSHPFRISMKKLLSIAAPGGICLERPGVGGRSSRLLDPHNQASLLVTRQRV